MEFSVLWMPFTSWIVYVLLEKGQAIETDDNALLFRVHFGLDTGVIYFMKLYLMFYLQTFCMRLNFYHINKRKGQKNLMKM